MAEAKHYEPVWEYIPLDAYRLPADTVQRTLSIRISSYWSKVRLRDTKPELPVDGTAELKELTPRQLQIAAPNPDWLDAAGALKDALAEKFSETGAFPVVAVVGAPFSGQSDALSTVAKMEGWRIAAPPSPEQILDADREWSASLRQAESPWLIPLLEKCFLRHEKGLNLVRRLIMDAVSGRLGRGVIGCGSWAWAYLQKVSAEIDVLPAVTPQALDAHRLQHWLSAVTFNNGPEKTSPFYAFRRVKRAACCSRTGHQRK